MVTSTHPNGPNPTIYIFVEKKEKGSHLMRETNSALLSLFTHHHLAPSSLLTPSAHNSLFTYLFTSETALAFNPSSLTSPGPSTVVQPGND